jgi:energy-coupling factor transporter ATP-binding protein EcfA2
MQIIIGLVGYKQSGKSTTVEILKEFIPSIKEVSFAGKMKNVCSELFNIPRNYFDDGKIKELPLEEAVTLDEVNVAAILKAYDVPDSDLDKFTRPHIGKVLHSPRQIGQYVGTEVLRAVHTDIHIIHAFKDLPQEGIFVVSDIRFPNELEYPRSQKGVIFTPFYIDNSKAAAIAEGDTHESERHIKNLKKECTVINNNGSMENLRLQIAMFATTINTHKELSKMAGIVGAND